MKSAAGCLQQPAAQKGPVLVSDIDCARSGAQSSTLGSGRAWSLQGYRPEPSVLVTQLRCRPIPAFTPHNTREQEIRQLALYCSVDERTTLDLMRALRLRRRQLQQLCAHWSVDYRRRDLIPAGQEVR